MKTRTLPPTPLKVINKVYLKKTITSLLLVFLLGWPCVSLGQLNVSITQTGTSANSCSRTLTAQVQNGSGDYSYSWVVSTPGLPFPGPSNSKTIHAGIGQTTDFIVSVVDNASNLSGTASSTVQRVLLGDFDIFRPNAFTPNNDGYNDIWMVTDGNKGFGPINAYGFELIIRNLNNNVLYQTSSVINSGHLGLVGGDISWNGRLNGTGSLVAVGTYTYSLQVQNCTASTTFNGYIDVIY